MSDEKLPVPDIILIGNYPPDKQEKATQTVLEQAALLTDLWAAA